jgi:4-amino-4-deoxy-L-arabinose transferase-like glycosyltransferase
MQKQTRLLYLFAIIKFILPFFLQDGSYGPHRDEFLYLAEARHMDWGYMEVPPLLSVLAWFTNFLGSSMFWIKFWPSLFGALTYILVGKTVLSLGGKGFALFLGFLPFILDAYLRVHFLFQPNFLEIFFWTLMALSLIRHIQTGKNWWLYVFGISLGLGMMSKYSVAFYAVSIFAALAITRQRRIFLNKNLYYALLLAFLIFLPNLLWQYFHHFPIVYHMEELQKNQLQYVSHTGFLFDQILLNLPCVFVWIAGLICVFFSHDAKQYRFIGIAYFIVIVLLLIGRGKNYYSLGVYPILFSFGAYYLEKLTSPKRRMWRYGLVIFPCIVGYFSVPLLMPLFAPPKLASFYESRNLKKIGVLKWEDLKNHPLPQDFADMLGWEEMAEKAGAAYASLDTNERKNTIVFCDNYGEAGALGYYGKKYGLPEAYSDNASFLYWMPDTLHFSTLILVTDDRQEMQHPFIHDFESAYISDSVTSIYARERGTLIIVLKKGNEQFQKMFLDKIAKDKTKVSW